MTFNSAEHRQRIKEQSKTVADYMNTKLSPATEAVLDAFRSSHIGPGCLAATLRAAADQVVPVPIKAQTSEEHWALLGVKNRLLAVADEIEGQ